MGCSSSNMEESKAPHQAKNDASFSGKMNEEKGKIDVYKNKLDIIAQKNPNNDFKEKFDAFKIAVREDKEEEINEFLNKYKEHFEQEKLDKKVIVAMALNSHAEDILPSEFEIKEWNVHEIIIEITNDICENIEENKIKSFIDFLRSSEKVFPKVQYGILYDIPSEKDDIVNIMNKQLKLNDKFNKMHLINIQFRSDNENDNIFEEIGEIIKYNLNLCTLVIFYKFKDYEKYHQKFEKFNYILDSIKSHKNLKALVLNFEENTGYTFPNIFYDGLCDIIINSTIEGIFLNSCSFNELNLNKFLSALKDNKRLKFIGINFIDPLLPCFVNLIKSLETNKSLVSVFISGGNLEKDQIDLLYTKTKTIKIVEYRNSIL